MPAVPIVLERRGKHRCQQCWASGELMHQPSSQLMRDSLGSYDRTRGHYFEE